MIPVVNPTNNNLRLYIDASGYIYVFMDTKRVAVLTCTKPGYYQMDDAEEEPHAKLFNLRWYTKRYPTVQTYRIPHGGGIVQYTHWKAWGP